MEAKTLLGLIDIGIGVGILIVLAVFILTEKRKK